MDKLTKAFSDYAKLQHVSQGRENREITSMRTDGNHFLFEDSKGETSASFTSPHTSQQLQLLKSQAGNRFQTFDNPGLLVSKQ